MSSMELKKMAELWFSELRDAICVGMESIEMAVGSKASFEKRTWDRADGGGGVASSIRGKVFEKAGVNISTVFGPIRGAMSDVFSGSKADTFWASGISVVIHPTSPLIPSAHMNTRLICTDKTWFGGVADITPAVEDEEAENIFHNRMRDLSEQYSPGSYMDFKRQCSDYFFLEHRGVERGSGGVFYDYLNSGDTDKDFALCKSLGVGFLDSYLQIVSDKMHLNWTDEQKALQLKRRGRYVEFNLLYDRGTKFGLLSGGDTDAIMMSMPPQAAW